MRTNEKGRLQKFTWIIYSTSIGVEPNTILNHLKGSWIAPKVSSLGAETIVICEGTIPESRSNLWSEWASSMMRSCPKNKFQYLQGGATLFWDNGYEFPLQKQAASAPGQGSWSGWYSAVRPSTDQPPQARIFLVVGVEAFVPDCLLDGTGQRWRCGERRKTMWWTSVVRAQIHRFVACYINSPRGTQAAGVYRIDRMSAQVATMQGMFSR